MKNGWRSGMVLAWVQAALALVGNIALALPGQGAQGQSAGLPMWRTLHDANNRVHELVALTEACREVARHCALRSLLASCAA